MNKVMVLLAGFIVFCGRSLASEPDWQEISRGGLKVEAVLLSQDNPRIVYIGTKKGIFKTENSGESWRNVFILKGSNRKVNYLACDSKNGDLYAATANGLYFSFDKGSKWARLFKGKSSYEDDCLTVAILSSGIYLGTKSGLFISKDKGHIWKKEQSMIGNKHILNIVSSGVTGNIYISCVDGVFKSLDNGNTWERIFVARANESDPEGEEDNEDKDEGPRISEIRYVAIDPAKPEVLYLATVRGIYWSWNYGKSWEMFPEYGLLSRDTRFLLFSDKSEFLAVTKSGIFAYRDKAWQELSFNLSVREIGCLGFDNLGNLYACTDKGLFKTALRHVVTSETAGIIARYSKGEPGIGEVQKQAIKYAEVDPEKIVAWRRQAKNKAILPHVSLGVDRNSGDLWHWEGGSTTKENDDYLRKGRDTIDWDISLSWDLGELIWNSDQTSIDARSRLLVQLRGDILDEVNKVYFERIRVKMELDDLRIEDRKKRFEKELRLRELTASLDALTGGYFSQHIYNQA